MLRYWPHYCDICILEDEKTCVDKAWMDDWKEVSICRDGSVATRRQATETPALDNDTAAHKADLAVKGSWQLLPMMTQCTISFF